MANSWNQPLGGDWKATKAMKVVDMTGGELVQVIRRGVFWGGVLLLLLVALADVLVSLARGA
jgi:hypothetical protein